MSGGQPGGPGRGPSKGSKGYNPTTFLSRGGIGQNELDLLHAAVYADLRGAGGANTLLNPDTAQAGTQAGGAQHPRRATPGPSNDPSLLNAMTKRLHQCEAHARALKDELVAKDKQLRESQRMLAEARAPPPGGVGRRTSDVTEEAEVLRIQNAKLALQIVEMTQFLKEQGYEWVGSGRVSPLVRGGGGAPCGSSGTPSPKGDAGDGGGASVTSSSCEQFEATVPVRPITGGESPAKPFSLDSLPGGGGGDFTWGETHCPPEPLEGEGGGGGGGGANAMYFSMDTLKLKVSELNLYAGEKIIGAEARLADGREIKKFKDPDSVEVVIYSDGICVDRGVFRPFGWPLCRAFLDDILDGYYPYEYQEKYPQGMVLKLVDRSAEAHPSDPGLKKVHGIDSCDGYRVLNKEAFLGRVPKQIITSTGKMVNVRDGIRAYIGGDAGQEGDGNAASVEPIEIGGPGASVMLQVRVVGGGTVVARLHPHSTIGEVRAFVESQLPQNHKGKAFDLLTAYPRVTFADDSQSLESANLVPNAALLMRFR